MSKSFIQSKTIAYPYPSRFGSHKSMVVKEDTFNTDCCFCEDEFGIYHTKLSRLDNGRADPNRYASSRLQNLFQNRKKDG